MIERRAEAAVERTCARLIAAADALPDDVTIARDARGVVLSGGRLARRRIDDVRIRGFAVGVGR